VELFKRPCSFFLFTVLVGNTDTRMCGSRIDGNAIDRIWKSPYGHIRFLKMMLQGPTSQWWMVDRRSEYDDAAEMGTCPRVAMENDKHGVECRSHEGTILGMTWKMCSPNAYTDVEDPDYKSYSERICSYVSKRPDPSDRNGVAMEDFWATTAYTCTLLAICSAMGE
jgi:hypothetical protein